MPCLLRSLLIAECQTWTCGEHLNRFCFCFFFFFVFFFFFFFHEQWSSRLRSKSKPFHWKWLYWWYSFAHVLYFETTGMLPEATVASGLLQTDLWYLNIYIYVFIYLCVLCMYIYIERENHICQYLYIPIYHNLSECPRKLWVLTHYPWNLTSWILPPSASWLLLGGSQATLWSDPNPDIGKGAHQNITKLI